MTITDQSRNQLYNRLEEVLGHDEAAVLMAHLPPVGWADVATKQDLAQLELRLELRIESAINAALVTQTRVIIFALLGAMATNAGIIAGMYAVFVR